MKKTLLAFIFAAVPLCLNGQNLPVNGFCEQGATPASVQGIPSVNNLQGVISACTVKVFLTGTQTLATIYSNAGGSSLSNPFNASSSGQWIFYSATGQGYDVVLYGGGNNPNCNTAPACYTTPVTITGVFTSGSGSGSVIASPQFSVHYQPDSGSQAVAQGDPDFTTDGAGNVSSVSLKSNVNGLINVAAPPYNAVANGCGVGGTDQTAAFNAAIAAAQAAHTGILIPGAALPYQVTSLAITGQGISVVGQGYLLSNPFPAFGDSTVVTGSALCGKQTSGPIFGYKPSQATGYGNGTTLSDFYVQGSGTQGTQETISSCTESSTTATCTITGSDTVPADTQIYIAGNTVPLTTVAIPNGGAYSVCPTGVSFSGGVGSGATATVACTGSSPTIVVSSVTITSGGAYSYAPAVSFTGGTGTAATAVVPPLAVYNGVVTVRTSAAGTFTFVVRGFISGLGTGTGGTATEESTCVAIGDSTTSPVSYPTNLQWRNVGGGNCGVGFAELVQNTKFYDTQAGGNFADGVFVDGTPSFTTNTAHWIGGHSSGSHVQFDMATGGGNDVLTDWDFENPPLNDPTADMAWWAGINSKIGPGNYYEDDVSNLFTGDAIYIPYSIYASGIKIEGGNFNPGTGVNAAIESASAGPVDVDLWSGHLYQGGILLDSTANRTKVEGIASCGAVTSNTTLGVVATDVFGDVCSVSSAITNSQNTTFAGNVTFDSVPTGVLPAIYANNAATGSFTIPITNYAKLELTGNSVATLTTPTSQTTGMDVSIFETPPGGYTFSFTNTLFGGVQPVVNTASSAITIIHLVPNGSSWAVQSPNGNAATTTQAVALANGTTATTQAHGDTSTDVATDAFVAAAIPPPPLIGTSASIGGSALLVNNCSTGTATVTGVTSAMAVVVTPVADPNGATTQDYDWYGYMSGTNTVTVKVCAIVAGTPAATTYNVRAF